MNINKAGLKIIETSESLRLKSYLCSAGVPTIGFGTTKYPNGKKVELGQGCTEVQAREWFAHDLAVFEKVVEDNVEVELNENQFSALVSLVYNIGGTNFKKSTLLQKLNEGDYEGASEQFLVWRKAGGKVLAGLEVRRAKEKALFDTKLGA